MPVKEIFWKGLKYDLGNEKSVYGKTDGWTLQF